MLVARGERVLVCSAQNVAIHQLAMRVLNEGLQLGMNWRILISW